MNKRKAICPGSFDPITNGHVDIILKARDLFDSVYVVIMVNSSKNSFFTKEERFEMTRQVFENHPEITVMTCDGLLVDFAKSLDAATIVKGLRNGIDFNYELEMAFINKKLAPETETVFIPTRQEYLYLSSSMVREAGRYGQDLSDYIPDCICETVSKKLSSL